MKRMLAFELYRNKRNYPLFAAVATMLIVFAIYAFTLHLNTMIDPKAKFDGFPLNISYAVKALELPLSLLINIVALLAAASVQSDIHSRLVESILCQEISRRRYFAGKTVFYLAILVVIAVVIAAASFAIAHIVFEGRFPISRDDIEILTGEYAMYYSISVIEALLLAAPIVIAVSLLGYLGIPFYALALLLALVWRWSSSLVSSILRPAILVDYQFDLKLASFLGWKQLAIVAVALVIAAAFVVAARRLVYKRDL